MVSLKRTVSWGTTPIQDLREDWHTLDRQRNQNVSVWLTCTPAGIRSGAQYAGIKPLFYVTSGPTVHLWGESTDCDDKGRKNWNCSQFLQCRYNKRTVKKLLGSENITCWTCRMFQEAQTCSSSYKLTTLVLNWVELSLYPTAPHHISTWMLHGLIHPILYNACCPRSQTAHVLSRFLSPSDGFSDSSHHTHLLSVSPHHF